MSCLLSIALLSPSSSLPTSLTLSAHHHGHLFPRHVCLRVCVCQCSSTDRSLLVYLLFTCSHVRTPFASLAHESHIHSSLLSSSRASLSLAATAAAVLPETSIPSLHLLPIYAIFSLSLSLCLCVRLMRGSLCVRVLCLPFPSVMLQLMLHCLSSSCTRAHVAVVADADALVPLPLPATSLCTTAAGAACRWHTSDISFHFHLLSPSLFSPSTGIVCG